MKINLKKEFGNLIPYSAEDKKNLDKLADGAIYEIDIKNIDMRSIKQNSAIHLWCNMIAQQLNNNGLYVSDIIKTQSHWNMSKVKENIFKPVVKSLYDKDSTTKLKKDEFEQIIDTIIQAFATKGIVISDFPNRQDLEE